MTYTLLHAHRLRTVVIQDALVDAEDVGHIRDAATLFAEAGRLRDQAEHDIADVRESARTAAAAIGRAEGHAAAAAITTAALAKLHAEATALEAARRADVARLALEVVRRIAGDLGPSAIVAAIADRATQALGTDTVAVIRVAEQAVDSVRERLAGRPGLSVEGDATLDPFDCIVETPLGRTHAGLETQIAAIGRAWDVA